MPVTDHVAAVPRSTKSPISAIESGGVFAELDDGLDGDASSRLMATGAEERPSVSPQAQRTRTARNATPVGIERDMRLPLAIFVTRP